MKYLQSLSLILLSFWMISCSTQQKIGRQAKKILILDSSLTNAHVGIAVKNPETGRFIYVYQSDKYFTPASNTKIYTAYAAMKYLPTNLVSAKLTDIDTAVVITPAGDPTFLHPEFSKHPLFDTLKKVNKPIYITEKNWQTLALGSGWSWNDYNEEYMTERSALPVYANRIQWFQEGTESENPAFPKDQSESFVYSNPEVDWPVTFSKTQERFNVRRDLNSNSFTLFTSKEKSASVSVPFITKGVQTGISLLSDSLGIKVGVADASVEKAMNGRTQVTIFSQSTDTLLKKMMYRSDNFYADQSLLMVSQQNLNKLDENAIIKELLSTDLQALPQKPRWVDGSGLSRYNQFTPEDMIHVLEKIRSEQPWSRIKAIFPQQGTGTLGMYRKKEGDFIFAKSGSMSGVLCLSGYVFSKKKNWLIFSIMINNHNASGAILRKKIETFLESL